MSQYKRIFAALDGGKTQDMVAERAIELAANEHAELLFGHVVDSVPYEAAGTDFAALAADVKEKLEESIADQLEAARNNPDIPHVEVVVKAGRITETLSEQIIEPFEPDLVICGERGLSNIKYVFVGSVSTYLIRNLRCDVLVVKQD
ncbi:universal stress protein [uncultured Slackia sp.]|uniref:universal stress protein n=1 Tax=uncultured Slackia sp. TaxID=665903 RepID=UPI0025CE26BB|nr:universal stress protein [uncultured Slackia sp.]